MIGADERGTHRRRAAAPAFTLVETLAVIAIVATVASVSLVGVRGMMSMAAEREALRAVEEADWIARLTARCGDRTTLTVDDADGALVVRAGRDHRLVARRELREGMSVALAAEDGSTLAAVHFDGAGRSVDYVATVHGLNRVWRSRVGGLTGFIRIEVD